MISDKRVEAENIDAIMGLVDYEMCRRRRARKQKNIEIERYS